MLLFLPSILAEAMFELAKLLENKYPDFKYKKSQKYLEKKTKKYS